MKLCAVVDHDVCAITNRRKVGLVGMRVGGDVLVAHCSPCKALCALIWRSFDEYDHHGVRRAPALKRSNRFHMADAVDNEWFHPVPMRLTDNSVDECVPACRD